jgi:hypothetical protein
MPNSNVPMTASQSSYSRSSEEGEVRTRYDRHDGEKQSEARDCYGIVSGNFSERRKCDGEGVGLSKV